MHCRNAGSNCNTSLWGWHWDHTPHYKSTKQQTSCHYHQRIRKGCWLCDGLLRKVKSFFLLSLWEVYSASTCYHLLIITTNSCCSWYCLFLLFFFLLFVCLYSSSMLRKNARMSLGIDLDDSLYKKLKKSLNTIKKNIHLVSFSLKSV